MGTTMTDLNELQFFSQVAKSHSFTMAAERLGVPKSSVSRAISRLEDRLGVRLIERTTRRVSLTEAGELYFDRCQRVLEQAEQADLVVGSMQAKPRGRLRVGTPIPFARFILAPLLPEFLSLYPDLRVHLHILGGASARESSLDVIIRPSPFEDSGLLVKPLMRIRLGAYASPAYLKDREIPNAPADLRRHSSIAATCGAFGEPVDSATWRLRRGSETKEVRIESRISVPDPSIIHQLALAGVGIALISQGVARHDVDSGRLVRLLPEWEPDPVELCALYSSHLSASPNVRAFLEFLRSHFRADLCLATLSD